MTDPFFPTGLRVTPEPPIALARTEASLAFLTSPALRMLIAERIEQIEVHGHLPDTDMAYQDAELALARARAESIRARYDYTRGAARLLSAMGLLQPGERQP